MARVVRTPAARRDLRRISRYIADESGSRTIAKRFLDSIDAKCTLYAATPELGELCAQLGADVRRFPIGQYIIFYRAVRRNIQILRVLHGSRDIPSVWEHE
jgi:toxin ParE1/3/4